MKIFDKNQKVRVLRRNLSVANLNKVPKKIILSTIICVVILFYTVSSMNLSINMNKPIDDELIPFNDNPNLNSQGANITEFVCGVKYDLGDLDPQFTWDSASIDVIDQVCEGLYRYNLSDPDLAIIPNLATAFGIWSSDKKNYTISLREDVLFHDGTPFNATSVKWSFDRLQYFMNTTGSLPEGKQITIIAELYSWPDGTPIINRTEIVTSNTIKFILNKPFVPFLGLLCFSGSYILSPTSTPANEYINTAIGDLVGTGPFVYDGYIAGIEVNFHAFEDYWRGEAKIKSLVFSIISDANARNQALLSGDIDLLSGISFSYLDQMESDPDITVTPCDQSLIIDYLGMNNKQINKTWRKAISYAINYSYIIEELKGGQAVRMKSPIPEGILYANWSFNVATYNLTKAREYMVSMGYGDLGWPNATWQAATFATFNYTYNTDNSVRANMLTLLQNNLDLIGIEVTDAGMSWWDYFDRLTNVNGGHDKLQLFWIGWMPDYNDPSNFINPLFSNTSINNAAQVNDPYLESLMEAGLEETNPILREAIYDEIQQYIVEDLMPWAFGYVENYYDAYRSEFTGYPSNPMRKVWLLNVSPSTPVVGSPADITYEEGMTGHVISWTATDKNPSSYIIYRDGVEVNSGSWTSGVPIIINVDGLTIGSYNYIINVTDVYDNSVTDVVIVTVEDTTDPVVDSPIDITYEEGTTGHVISWTATDNNPGNYTIYRDGVEVDSSSWISGVPIAINVDGLTVGIYNYTINITDESNNTAIDTVLVAIEDTTAPGVGSPDDITYEEGTTGHVISWNATDNNPGSYIINRDGVEVNSGSWISGVSIIINVDGLTVGSYNYTINVSDAFNNTAIDTVLVNVTSSEVIPPVIAGYPWIVLIFSLCFAISIVILIIKRKITGKF